MYCTRLDSITSQAKGKSFKLSRATYITQGASRKKYDWIDKLGSSAPKISLDPVYKTPHCWSCYFISLISGKDAP